MVFLFFQAVAAAWIVAGPFYPYVLLEELLNSGQPMYRFRMPDPSELYFHVYAR